MEGLLLTLLVHRLSMFCKVLLLSNIPAQFTNNEFGFIIFLGSAVNGFRASIFLTASATGHKLPPLVVFAGMPGGPVSQEVFNPSFGANDVEHTVQKKAFCDERVMIEWIERVRCGVFHFILFLIKSGFLFPDLETFCDGMQALAFRQFKDTQNGFN